MSKQTKKQHANDPVIENKVETVESTVDNDEQAVSSVSDLGQDIEIEKEKIAETEISDAVSDEKLLAEKDPKMVEKTKSGGKGIALLALLVAVGIGAAGHFFASNKFSQVEAQIQTLAQKSNSSVASVEVPNFDNERAQIAELVSNYQKSLSRVEQLEREQASYTQQINVLKDQIQKLGAGPKTDQSEWLLSDADFLLNNALRKVVLDNDIDTARSLLIEADNVLSQVSDTRVLSVRDAIKNDLNQLASVNKVDQNNLMQRLAQLANQVDDMPILPPEDETNDTDSGEVSGSIEDWQKNIEKSADSFLNHFIRISDKAVANEKAFIAPNQEIYLRENIRLRLQIAILTITRQQNELYKQSLEAVSSWVRSYFDVQNDQVKAFLKEVDDLIEQSIYIDAPSRLQSLGLLDQLLNKAPQPIGKIQIDEDKSLEQLSVKPEASPVEQSTQEPAASEPKSTTEQP
ncbi:MULTISPECIES: uroporphyrinogen-III C-methyltransferase [Glaesserella]|uniref:HemX protein n=1 Tax=Glaesserella australis TaxID=2094024 RepID=A0A328BWQ8_9PAST|nr:MULTISPECIES: uroporphyrinogen-III C-methyltransferase [Glaesserella]AUI65331.1 HemX protein [Glaesserella sp. 15-184]RAL18603.1 HemX protein [Glaesserella australis]